MIIDLDELEYQQACQYARNMWANTKTGFYGSGILNTKSDPYKTERIGILGEMALAKYMQIPYTLEYIHGGDQWDFLLGGITIDVKTASYDYKKMLIKKTNDIKCYIYVAAYLEEDNGKTGKINLVGWLTKNTIYKHAKIEKGLGKWLNYVIYYDTLSPIDKLQDYLNAASHITDLAA